MVTPDGDAKAVTNDQWAARLRAAGEKSKHMVRERVEIDAWDRWGQKSADAVTKLITRQVASIDRSTDRDQVLAIHVGAILAASRHCFASCASDGRMAMEALLIATVRGAMRGRGCALNEDGSVYGVVPPDVV